MSYIYRDGTSHAWPDGRAVPKGWELRPGAVPGPHPPTLDQRIEGRLAAEIPELTLAASRDGSDLAAKLKARAAAIEAEERQKEPKEIQRG